jgi:hypothetical protein
MYFDPLYPPPSTFYFPPYYFYWSSPRKYQHFLLFAFLTITILTAVKWNLSVILICISFMAEDVFISHLYFFWELSNSFAHLLIELFALLLFNFCIFHILTLYLCWRAGKNFIPSVGCVFILVLVSFDVQKLSNLRQPHLSIPTFISCAIGVIFRK